MQNLIASLKNDFVSFKTSIEAIQNSLIVRANEERVSMLTLLAKMQETKNLAKEVADLSLELSGLLNDCGEVCIDLYEKVTDVLYDPMELCPSTPYEKFVGFCEDCGKEVVSGDCYSYNEDEELVCEKCKTETITA